MPTIDRKHRKNDFKAIKISVFLILALYLGLFVVKGALAENTEYKSPTATGEKYDEWINPEKAFTSNFQYTFVIDDIGEYKYQSYENFNFDIPENATITDIFLSIEGFTLPIVGEMKAGIWSENENTWYDLSGNLPFAERDIVIWDFGFFYETGNFIPSDFSNENFNLRVFTPGFNNDNIIHVEHLQIIIYYSFGIPPPELPEIEDCSEYGLTDRLLCEIKNFFARLFIPSPEKITELRDTLDTIKTKFPYNYIIETKNFFTYLKDNINEEQDINFSILGNAGVVNFSFWNSTTTLAGSSQTFLIIFKTLFQFIIIMIFIIWCFSFFKRIF